MEVLQRGQRFSIEDKLGSKALTLAFNWSGDTKNNFLELYPLLISGNSIITNKSKITGVKILKNSSKFKTQYYINSEELSSDIDKVLLVIYSSSSYLTPFSDFSAYIITEEVNFEFKIDNFDNLKTYHLIEIYKKNSEWKINVLLRGFNSNLHESLSELNKSDLKLFCSNFTSLFETIKSTNKTKEKKVEQLLTMNNLKAFCQKHISLKDSLNSEEATKHSLIAPFLKLLGYDSTNPDEVIPELPATYGINKRSEKVDYAILINKVPVILIECKSVGSNLSFVNEQLFRYFNSVPTAKIGIVTDGIKYLFYSDTEALNRMDKDYYFEIDLETELTEEQLFELNRYCKSNFNLDSIHESAKRLKLKLDLKDKISNELLEPSDNFINFFINQSEYSDIREIFESSLFESIKEVYQIIGNSGNKIITTQEELEGFIIVKSLLRNYIDYKRITYKDTVNYFSVQIDGSSYKTICRLWLNGKIKYLGIIDENKSETKYPISSIDNIFEYSELIINSAKRLGG